MKRKLFTLLTLLLCVCGGAWADTETIFSATPTAAWSVPASTTDAEITSSYATIFGGKMYLTNEQASAKDMIKSQGGEMAFQQTNNNTFFKVELEEPLQAGDVISASMQSRTDADLGLLFSTESSRPNDATTKIFLATASSQAWVTALEYTVAEGDGICGETTFYIYRYTGKSTYFNTFTITREVAASAPSITTQPVSATYKQNSTATALTVAATASAGNLSYQWYSNTTESTTGATEITGATTASYTPSTAALGTTYYFCAVTDVNGTTNSNFASIIISNTITIGRTLEFSETPTEYTFVSASGIATVTLDDGTGDSGTKKGGMYYKGSSKTINATCYRSWSGATTYDENRWAGFKVELQGDYNKLNVTKLEASVAVSQNFTYKLVLLDKDKNVIYTSSDKTITSYNNSNATNLDCTIAPEGGLGIVGKECYVRLYYYFDNASKYLAPLKISLTGEPEENAAEYTITTAVSGDGEVSGNGTFVEGQKATLKAIPGASTFEKWTKASDVTWTSTDNPIQVAVSADEVYTAVFAAATTHTITAEIADGQSDFGSITNAGDNEVVENETITLVATANTGYTFVNWTKGSNTYSTDASITITSTEANAGTYTANFKKLFIVTYNLGEYAGTIGKVLNNVNSIYGYNEVYSDDADNYTIPAYAHKYLYNEGYVFDKWQDGDGNTYDSGEVIAMTKDITLTPTWKATSQALSASSTENFVEWSFAKDDMVFFDWQSNDKFGYYSQEAMVNGERITVPMSIIKGKVANYTRTDAIAQTNQNTTFTIPAVKGMTIEIKDANTAFSTTTIAGSTEYTGSGTTSISYTYEGDDPTIDIVIGEGNQYLKTIEVTYPVNLTSTTITPAYAKSTYVTTYPLSFSTVEGLKAYIATDASDGKVTLEEVHEVPAGTPLMLIGTAETEYTVPVDVAASFLAFPDNMFVAGDGTTEFDGSTYDYILYSDGLFYQIGSGKVATTKAYLHCDSDPTVKVNNGSRGLTLVFGGEATGISSVNGDEVNAKGYFNLSGQRVSQPSKGLYIVEGKKVIIK